MDISSEIDSPLTTVKTKMELLGQAAIKKLISIINEDYKREIKNTISNKITERQPCRKVETL